MMKLILVLETIQRWLNWLFAYPLLLLLILFFYLIALFRFGYGLGADDMFWSEKISEQIFNGLACGLLFGEILLVRYSLDPQREAFRCKFSLFTVKNVLIHKLGEFLFLSWIPSLLFFVAKLFSEDVRENRVGAVLDPLRFPRGSGLQGNPPKSLSAIELFRLFPGAKDKLEIGTAARMNASFPLISPGVSLPTDPPRRVVDAGYFDNYGIDLLANWLMKHEKALRENTSGVVLIEIRAYRSSYARSHFQDRESEKTYPEGKNPEKALLEDNPQKQIPRRDTGGGLESLEWLSTPIEAILNTRERAPIFRNDEMLDHVDHHLNSDHPGDRTSKFFTTISFECDVDAALSWSLPRGEAEAIARAFTKADGSTPPMIARKIRLLKKWFESEKK